jgi:xylan 1,4-beta-xylosidase
MARRWLAGVACAVALAAATGSWAGTARFERFSYQGRSQERVATTTGAYRNPILSGYYPDPSVLRVGEDYYLINSSFAHFPGIPIFHSRDLVSWTQIGNAISRPTQLDFSGKRVSQGVFAPDISFHDGLFYIVNTCVECGGNFVITATDPKGPWSDPVWLPFEGIDPSIYWEGDKAYIVNNGPPDEAPRYDGHRAIWVQEFDWRARTMVGPRTQIVNGGVDISQKPSWIEGPHLFKRGNYYYLIAAEGGTGDNHSEVVFRASAITGPFVPFPGNPILTQRGLDPKRPNPVTSAGHAKFVQTQAGDWWATFLATRPYGPDQYNIGRETFLLPVTWRDDWPMILPPGQPIPYAAARPKLPAQPRPALPTSGDIDYVEEFTGTELGMHWIGVRTPRTPIYRLDGGALVIDGGGRLGDQQSVPALIARRQQHHVATAATTMRYQPDKDGDRAGLVAMQNDDFLLFYGVTKVAGKTVLQVMTRKAGQERVVASAPATGDLVTLTIRADGGRMSFDAEAGGRKRTILADLDVTFLSTAQAGGFVGTIIGPFAYCN